MSLSLISWTELMDRWRQNPQELLAWLSHLLWMAEIEPESPAFWKAELGLIVLGESRAGHRVNLRLCDKCSKHVPWKSMTLVPESECMCHCHLLPDKSEGEEKHG